jgi:hypothetical protein
VTGSLVDIDPLTSGIQPTFFTSSPFFPANPAVVRAMAANSTTGALFGGAFFNATAQKLVATFTNLYSPPSPLPPPPFGPNPGTLPGFVALGPTQFYASALLPNGDLLIGGDVGVNGNASLPASPDDLEAVLYRIDPCGTVSVVARFRNIPGYLVRNGNDNGVFVSPPQDINATPGQGFRRVDVVDPPSIRAIAVDSAGNIYVGGQFNQVSDGPNGPFQPWNNLIRLKRDGKIDPLFAPGAGLTSYAPGYPVMRLGGPTGFGVAGSGLNTVDPETAQPLLVGTCDTAPTFPPNAVGLGRKLDPNEGRVNAIVLQPDGRILIGGEFKCYNGIPRGGLARLLPNGSLDTSFGDPLAPLPGVDDYSLCDDPISPPGVPRADPAVAYNRARVNAILLQPDGRVVVGGLFGKANGIARYNLARFDSAGFLDLTFSSGPTGMDFPTGTSGLGASLATGANKGPTSNGRGGEIFALARQSLGANAGRILVGGAFTRILNPVGLDEPGRARTAFTRFEPNGRHDATFAQLSFTAAGTVRAIALQADDRPIIGGPFRIGPGTATGTQYTSNTTRVRVFRCGVNGAFTDTVDSLNIPRSSWLAVQPLPGVTVPFQPGPYAVPSVGSLASVFATTVSEINYYPGGSGSPAFGGGFLNGAMAVNTITLDPARRRAYIGGLFNVFESARADLQNDNAGAPNGLSLDIRWPGVAALQTGCTYGLVAPTFPPFTSPPFSALPTGPPLGPPPIDLGAINPAGGNLTIGSLTRSAVSACDALPTVSTGSTFVTIVGVVPRTAGPGPSFADIIINVSPNNTGANRTGSVTVTLPSETGTSPAPTTFTFTQGPASGCTFTATAVPASFPVAGGTGQFQITTGSGCS